MRVKSALHRRLPTFRWHFMCLVPGKSKYRRRFSVTVDNNQAFLAATVFWHNKPVVSFGMWKEME